MPDPSPMIVTDRIGNIFSGMWELTKRYRWPVLRGSVQLQKTMQVSVEQVHSAIGDATRAAEHQAQGAYAVRGRVEVIHAQAERAAEAVTQTTASGKVLDGLAAQLKASLGQFRA